METLIRGCDPEYFKEVTASVLGMLKCRDIIVKLFRIASAHTTAGGGGEVVIFEDFYEFLKGIGMCSPETENQSSYPPTASNSDDEVQSGGSEGSEPPSPSEIRRREADQMAHYNQICRNKHRKNTKKSQPTNKRSILKNLSEALQREKNSSIDNSYRRRRLSLGPFTKDESTSDKMPLLQTKPTLQLSYRETSQLFLLSAGGNENLTFTDFANCILRLSLLSKSTDIRELQSNPAAAVQHLYDDYLADFVREVSLTSEGDLALHYPLHTIINVDKVLTRYVYGLLQSKGNNDNNKKKKKQKNRYASPLRKLFICFAAKQRGLKFNDSHYLEVGSALLTFDSIMMILSKSSVTPNLLNHAVVYKVMYEFSRTTDSGDLLIDFESFIEILVKSAFLAYGSPPLSQTHPTVASRFALFVNQFKPLYLKEIGCSLDNDVSTSTSKPPTVLSIDPTGGDPNGGYQITITGRNFNKKKGLYKNNILNNLRG